MQVVKMTDRWLKSVMVEKGRTEFNDAIVRGLRLRVSSKSKKWSIVTRRSGKLARIPVGEYPDTSLQNARLIAADAIEDETVTAVAAPLRTMRQRQVTSELEYQGDVGNTDVMNAFEEPLPFIEDLCSDYIQNMKARGQKSHATYETSLVRGKFSFCAYMRTQAGTPHRAVDITSAHVTEWLRHTYLRSKAQGRHCRAYLHAVFNWGLRADYDFTSAAGRKTYGLKFNPVSATPSTGRANARSRVITLEELNQFWHALPDYASPRACSLIRMIIAMGGLRITELSQSKKSWYEDGWLKLPTTKNQKEHIVPLTKTAVEQYNIALAVSTRRSPYLFNNQQDVERPIIVSSLGKITRELIEGEQIEKFQLRDLRRTFKSHMLDQGLVDERALDIWHNHGQNSDVARRHYTFAEFKDLKMKTAKCIDGFLIAAII